MKIGEAQKIVDSQIMNYGGYWHPLSMILRLNEENGELARAINIKYGEKIAKSTDDGRAVGTELADVFYTALAIANSYNIDLGLEVSKNLNIPEIEEQSNIELIQLKLIERKKDASKYLVASLDLTYEIGKLGKLLASLYGFNTTIDHSKNIDIIDSITTIAISIIDVSSIFKIDLSHELSIKTKADESKMDKLYGHK